jgi:hypothetical protein
MNLESPTDAPTGENGQGLQADEEGGDGNGDDSMIDLDGGIEDLDDDSFDGQEEQQDISIPDEE